jgi:hypothetical protein
MKLSLNFSDLSKCSIELPDESEDESIDSILIYLCSFLGGRLDLHIGGFGQECWPISSDTDTADLLAQLSNTLKALKNFSPCEIIFSEQSLSRRLEFYPDENNCYKIQCLSWGSWVANPGEEIVDRHDLFNNFYKLFLDFIEGLRNISPQTLNNYWIRYWIKEIG